MEPISEKYSNPSRAIVFGLLVNCLFTISSKDCTGCPLRELRHNLSIEKKHEFAMGLSDKEIENILEKHEYCYEKRLSELNQW